MTKTGFPLFFCLLWPALVAAQDDSFVEPEPAISLARLVAQYYKIDWTDEQWEALAGRRLEMTYLIDKTGRPKLENVRGVEDAVMLDSLHAATARLPDFRPARQGGKVIESLYSFYFSFPLFQPAPNQLIDGWNGLPVPIDEAQLLSRYDRTHNAVFVDFAGTFVNHSGRYDNYLRPGIGLDVFIGGHSPAGWGGAIYMAIEGNDKRIPFPEDDYPEREEWATSISLGMSADRVLATGKRGLTSLRTELGYVAFNAANRLEPEDREGWVQYRGLHTGLALQHTIRIGRYLPNVYYDASMATARYSAITFSAGLRYRLLNGAVGNSRHWFVGVGYRLGRDDFKGIGRE